MRLLRVLPILSMMLYASPALSVCNSFSKNFSLGPDIGFGNQYFKSLTQNFQNYGVCKVDTADGFPARLGTKSIRFEVRSGDCGWSKTGWNDCQKDRSRHELSGLRQSDGEYWYAWSLYLPEGFINIFPTKLAMGQFHQENSHVVWMFQNGGGGYYVDRQTTGSTDQLKKIMNHDEMIGQWNDIIIHARWTHKKDGIFKVWVNGKLAYSHFGRTKTPGRKVYQKFGIYQSFLSRYKNRIEAPIPTQVVFFDEVRTSSSCEKLKLADLGYNCALLNQQELN